jgi:GTP-binding protein HflX
VAPTLGRVDRSRNGRTTQTRYASSNGAGAANPRARQRALAIGIVDGRKPADEPLAELKELLRTAGVATTGEATQQRPQPDPDRYFGRGRLEELKREIAACDANLVACDDELAPRQERNLEAALGVPVIDRTAVILDIFADHAHSAEGKLQVELAQLEYNMARMRGLWTHLERLGAGRMDGGIGTRGPGESQIETDRRLARDRISALRRRLARLERNRGVMRARRDRSSLPRVALAGYTNAGKSTLLNALTGAEVGVGDRLFHTLDPTTRSLELSGRDYLLTDTVGFIEKLPHQLVEAFKATLEETVLADLILHVVDASEPRERRQLDMRAVDEVLEEIGAGDKPRLLVLNKADLLGEEEREEIGLAHPGAVLVSAVGGEGLDRLRERVEAAFEETLAEVELLVPYAEGARLHELHEVAGSLERTDREDGVLVHAKVPVAELHRFDDLATGSAVP